MTVLRFPKPKPAIDLDHIASELLAALAQSRGIDAYAVADDFLKDHPDLTPADIVAVSAFAGKVVASFQKVLLQQIDSEGGAA
jgi:hypothetical protein